MPEQNLKATRTLIVRRLRIVSGLILLAFVTSHLINAALGVISIEAMDAASPFLTHPWSGMPLGLLLIGAAVVHAFLGLWSIYRRPTLRTNTQDVVQILTSVLVIPLGATHVVAMMALSIADVEFNYSQTIAVMWITQPELGLLQVIFLTVVWVHGCAGLLIWLRALPSARDILPWIYPLAVAIPIAALLGFSEAGRRALAENESKASAYGSAYSESQSSGYDNADNPAYGQSSTGSSYDSGNSYGASNTYDADSSYAAGNADETTEAPKVDLEWIIWLTQQMIWGSIVLALLTLLARAVRNYVRPAQRLFLSRNGEALDVSFSGPSLLDLFRRQNVPHASLCEGRGRCATCAVRVLSSEFPLPDPDALELRTLETRGVPAGCRLACQIYPGAGQLDVEAIYPPEFTFHDSEEFALDDAARTGDEVTT